MAEIISVRDVYKSYSDGSVTRVFEGASLSVAKGEFLGVFAPSGYGKSTLIMLIAGIEKPDRGDIVVDGVSVPRLRGKQLAEYRRRKIGIVFQFFNLFPHLTALENVMLPMRLIGVRKSEARKRALTLLKLVGLKEHANKFPGQLSGGEQQRVAIARALANEPPVLLADEPTGNLDEENKIAVLELLASLGKERDVTIVLATHDVQHARRYVTRAITIRNRKFVELS